MVRISSHYYRSNINIIKYIILLLLLCDTANAANRPNLEVNGKNCVIKRIYYDDINNYIHALGNCDILFEMCTEDFCMVKKVNQGQLQFGNENVGKK